MVFYNDCYDARMRERSGGRDRRAAEIGAEDSADAALVASRALVGIAARSLAAVEDTVTLVQYRALVLLASRGSLNVGGLAESLEIHPSTATRLCDRLAEKGFIDRTTSAESRREVTIALTSAGQALVRSVTARRRREILAIVRRLDPTTRAHLVEAFAAFGEQAGEIPESAWKLGWTA
jgi:DNA-binding MarR family transcriptional regulator